MKFLVLILLFVATVRSKICTNGWPCIELSQCEEVIKVVDNIHSTHSEMEAATSTYCGYLNEPYVCCNRNCTTPNSKYGVCIELEKCHSLKGSLLSQDSEKLKFLVDSFCRRKDGKTYVCCHDDNVYKKVALAPLDEDEE